MDEDDGPNRGRQVLRLIDELMASASHRLYREMMALGWSAYTFEANFRELEGVLLWLTNDAESEHLTLLRGTRRNQNGAGQGRDLNFCTLHAPARYFLAASK